MKIFAFIVLLKLIISKSETNTTNDAINFYNNTFFDFTEIRYKIIDPENHLKTGKNNIIAKMKNFNSDKNISIYIIILNRTEETDLASFVDKYSNLMKRDFPNEKDYILIAFEIGRNSKIIKRGENVKYLSNELDEVLNSIDFSTNYSKKICDLITTIHEIYGKNFSLFNILIIYLIIVCILLIVIVSLHFCSFKRGFNRDSDVKYSYTSMARLNTSDSSSSGVKGSIN